MAFVHVPALTSFTGTFSTQCHSLRRALSRQGCDERLHSTRRTGGGSVTTTTTRRVAPGMLFGFGRKQGAANANKKAGSNSNEANPYRALGVNEDATYEDVDGAVKRLSVKYADDRKKLMMLDVYKDKIFEDKLQQRMSGALQPKIKDSPYDRKIIPKKRFVMPEWAQGIFKIPDYKYTRRTGLIMGFFILLGFITPTLAGSCMAMAFIAAAGFLYNRGLPDPVRDDYGGIGEVRPVKHRIVGKTLLINLAVGAVFFGLGQLYMIYLPLPLFCPPDAFINLSVVTGLWMSCLFFIAQDADDIY